MKKINVIAFFAFTICLFFGTQTQTFAQKSFEKKLASQLCDCIDKTLAKYPVVVREMLADMTEVGKRKAEENMMQKINKMPEKQQNEAREAMSKFEEIKPELEKNCEKVGKALEQKIEKGETSERNIVEIMRNNKNCKIGYAMMVLLK